MCDSECAVVTLRVNWWDSGLDCIHEVIVGHIRVANPYSIQNYPFSSSERRRGPWGQIRLDMT